MNSLITEIAVLGGGPAAMALARRLTGLGHEVVVISRSRQPRTLEGFSERTLMLCGRFCGVEDWARNHDLIARDAYWNGERISANREAVVDRGELDSRIRGVAQREGIQIIDGRAGAIVEQDAMMQISVKGGAEGDMTISARFVVEARGRAAPFTGRSRSRGPRLVCLSKKWRFRPGDAAYAAVAPFRDGWGWFIRGEDGAGILQFFVDASSVRARPELEAIYASSMASMSEAGQWIKGGREESAVISRHAGMVISHDLCSSRHIRVGDAAMAIDPLSGHGVYKAVSNALAAAPVINTLLRRPEAATLASEFYRARVTDDFWTSARLARDFYREEKRWTDQPFWAERGNWPDDSPAHAPIEGGVARVERRPVSIENYVEERDVLVTPDQPRGVLHLGGVPAAEAWRLLDSGVKTSEAFADHFGVHQSTAVQALAWFAERRLGGTP